MQYEYTNAKLASIPLSLLLIVSALFGFVLLVPLNAAHAASPAVTLSASSATVGSSVIFSGTGFASGKALAITSAVSSTTIPWLTLGGCGTTNGGTAGRNSLIVANCLTTGANGDFQAKITVPALPGGPETITIYDGTNTVTTTLTITASLVLCSDLTVFAPATCPTGPDNDVVSSVYSETKNTYNFVVSGFGSGESVSFASSLFQSSFSPTCTTGSALNTYGVCNAAALPSQTFVWADASGGAHSITATGATTGLTASDSITMKPWVAFYNSQAGLTTFSFVGTAPTSVLVEGHGFASSATIAANTVTIGGVTTSHSAISTDSYGNFGAGGGNHVVLAPGSGVPYGPVSVVIAGTTFNYANGNIEQGSFGGAALLGVGNSNGGVLLSSALGNAQSTAIGYLDSTTHTFGDTPAFFLVGAAAGNAITVSVANLPGVTVGAATNTIEKANGAVPDGNGAWFSSTSAGSIGNEVAGTYTVGFTTGTVLNVLSPSYTTTPSVSLGFDTGTCSSTNYILQLCSASTSNDNAVASSAISGNMFAASTTVTVTSGGNTLLTATTGANGAFAGALTQTGGVYPAIDLAQGTWTATASDGTNTGTDTFAIVPIVDLTGASALTVVTGTPGTTTNLRTGSNFGVHGLMANTAYTINWGMIGTTGAQSLGTFTSTATGGIPVPGVQFTIPPGPAGNHLITIVAGTTDALFGVVRSDRPSTAGPTSQYGDMVFVEQVLGTIIPTVANVGQTVTLSGSGLSASTAYETTITSVTGNAGATGQIFSTFTTDASGNIPASTTLAIPAMATGYVNGAFVGCLSATYFEQATSYNVHFSTASEYPGTQDGQALFVLSGQASLNSTSEPAGHNAVLTATGLGNQCTYDIIFNYAVNPQATAFTGQVVGAFVTSTVGAGSATFTIPSTAAAGSYTIQLARVGTALLGILNIPDTLTVTTAAGACTSTTCFSAGTPTQTTSGIFQVLQVPFTNSASGSVTGIVYAVVHNAAGQTVYYTTATITPAGGAQTTATLVLSGLPHGTYSVTYFVTSTAGVAISSTGTTSVTL